jgi:hypothetical protein
MESNGKRGYAHGKGIETGAGKKRYRAIGPPGQHQRQGSRPELSRQYLCSLIEYHKGPRGIGVRHVGDQWIEVGPFLSGKNGGDRTIIGRIAAEPVYGLRRKCDQVAATQPFGRAGNFRRQ